MPKEKDPEILEGEVVSGVSHSQHEKKNSQNYFPFPKLVKLKTNCTLGCLIFLALIVIAIVAKSWLVFLLAFLLPAWLASRV
jgi:uncharacterized membrane protein